MTNINLFSASSSIDSYLSIKASGSIDHEIMQDLFLTNGKDISELLNDQTQTQTNKPVTK